MADVASLPVERRESPARRGAAVAGVLAVAGMVAAQVVLPFHPDRALLTTIVVAALAAAAWCFAAHRNGFVAATAALVAVAVVTAAMEWVGTATGYPFGSYRYTGELRPTVGTVPLLVPLAWFGLGAAAYEVGCRVGATRPARVVTAAIALTAWDLFLDPQMVRSGFWQWTQPGLYQGIPVSNFLGWLLTSAVVMVLFEALLAPRARSVALLSLYTTMAVMETVGFLFVFERDLLIASCGGMAMGVPAAVAWWRVAGDRRG